MISDEYAALNRAHMEQFGSWAVGGHRHRAIVADLITRLGCHSVLDYGCGRGTLGNSILGRDGQHAPIRVRWFNYDPSIPSMGTLPPAADLVVSTHVLEHVEPDLLSATLAEIRTIARKAIYVAVPHRPSGSPPLADGRNCHLIVKPPNWWLDTLIEAFGRVVEILPQSLTGSGLPRDETRFVFHL